MPNAVEPYGYSSKIQFFFFYLVGIIFALLSRLLALVRKEVPREVEELYWLNSLPPHLQPVPDKIRRLEHLRYLWGIPDDVFAFNVLAGTRWATEQVQRHLFERGKVETPLASDKEIFKEIIMARTSARIPYGLPMTEEDVDRIVESITSIDDLVEFILSQERKEAARERKEPVYPDVFGVRRKSDEILYS